MQGRDDLSLNDSDIEKWLSSIKDEPVVPEVNVVAPASIVPISFSPALASAQGQLPASNEAEKEESLQPLKAKRKRKRENRDVFVDAITCEPLPHGEETIKIGKFHYYKDRWFVLKSTILIRKYRFEDNNTLLTLNQKQSFSYDHTKKALCFDGRKVYWRGVYKPKNMPSSAVPEDVSARPQIQDVDVELQESQQEKSIGISYANNKFTFFKASAKAEGKLAAAKQPHVEYLRGGKCPRK